MFLNLAQIVYLKSQPKLILGVKPSSLSTGSKQRIIETNSRSAGSVKKTFTLGSRPFVGPQTTRYMNFPASCRSGQIAGGPKDEHGQENVRFFQDHLGHILLISLLFLILLWVRSQTKKGWVFVGEPPIGSLFQQVLEKRFVKSWGASDSVVDQILETLPAAMAKAGGWSGWSFSMKLLVKVEHWKVFPKRRSSVFKLSQLDDFLLTSSWMLWLVCCLILRFQWQRGFFVEIVGWFITGGRVIEVNKWRIIRKILESTLEKLKRLCDLHPRNQRILLSVYQKSPRCRHQTTRRRRLCTSVVRLRNRCQTWGRRMWMEKEMLKMKKSRFACSCLPWVQIHVHESWFSCLAFFFSMLFWFISFARTLAWHLLHLSMTMIFNWAKFPQAQAFFRLAVLSGKCWRCTEKMAGCLGFPGRKGLSLLLLEEILHQLIGYPTKYTTGMIHPRWWSPNFWINMTHINQESGWDGGKQEFHVLLPLITPLLPSFEGG